MNTTTSDIAVIITSRMLRERIPRAAPLEERCRVAMRAVLTSDSATFMCTTDDERFRSAVGAVLIADCPEADRARIVQALDLLKAISAAIGGVPVDFNAVLLTADADNVLPLLGIWHEETDKLKKEQASSGDC